MAFRVKSNLKYIFISLAEKDAQEISKVYSNAHWCYKYFFSRKKMLSTLFLTIYMGRGFYFKTTQTSLSNWLSLIYLQVLRKHNGEFPIMTKIHNPLQNVSYCKSVPNFLCSWLLLLKNVSFISYCREPVIINPLGKGGGEVGWILVVTIKLTRSPPPQALLHSTDPPSMAVIFIYSPFYRKGLVPNCKHKCLHNSKNILVYAIDAN